MHKSKEVSFSNRFEQMLEINDPHALQVATYGNCVQCQDLFFADPHAHSSQMLVGR